jgi:hypothetical protein
MLVVHVMQMTKQNQDKLQVVLIDLSFNLPAPHNPHSFLFVHVITFVVELKALLQALINSLQAHFAPTISKL